MAVLTKDNPARIKRDVAIAQSRIAGKTYREMAKEHGISTRTICRVLKDDEIKDIIETGTQQSISMIPLAQQVYYDSLTQTDDKGIRLKAAQDLSKMAGILPSNVQNQKITNIFNQQNNIMLSDKVGKALSGAFNVVNDGDTVEDNPIDV